MTDAGTTLGFDHVFEAGSNGWTLLLLHGTGGDEHDLVPLGRRLGPDAALLSPRGKVLEHGAPRFFRRHAVGHLDIADLLARTDELAEFVQQAVSAYRLDASRVVALGYSNGANIAVSLLLRHPGVLRGAGLLRAMLPYEPEQLPALVGTDVLVAAGTQDPYAPSGQVRRLVEILRDAGAEVTLHVEDQGHVLGHGDVDATSMWIRALTQR